MTNDATDGGIRGGTKDTNLHPHVTTTCGSVKSRVMEGGREKARY